MGEFFTQRLKQSFNLSGGMSSFNSRRCHYGDRCLNVMASLVTYNRLSEIDQGAIEVNKRLGRTLEFIKLGQDKRANNRLKVIQAVIIFRVTQKTVEEDALCSLRMARRGEHILFITGVTGQHRRVIQPAGES